MWLLYHLIAEHHSSSSWNYGNYNMAWSQQNIPVRVDALILLSCARAISEIQFVFAMYYWTVSLATELYENQLQCRAIMSLHNVLLPLALWDTRETHLFKETVGQLRLTAVLTPLSQCRQTEGCSSIETPPSLLIVL